MKREVLPGALWEMLRPSTTVKTMIGIRRNRREDEARRLDIAYQRQGYRSREDHFRSADEPEIQPRVQISNTAPSLPISINQNQTSHQRYPSYQSPNLHSGDSKKSIHFTLPRYKDLTIPKNRQPTDTSLLIALISNPNHAIRDLATPDFGLPRGAEGDISAAVGGEDFTLYGYV